jgi:hypothetical protein
MDTNRWSAADADTISVNGLSISHKASGGVSTATPGRVQDTQPGARPRALSEYFDVEHADKNQDRQSRRRNMAANKGSEYSISMGTTGCSRR